MSEVDKLHFQDLELNQTFELGRTSMSKASIIEFATEYDPQIFHLDEDVGNAVLGGIAASGLQTMCKFQRLLVDQFLNRTACLGGAGVDKLQFVRPVLADTPINGLMTVIDKRQSASKPERAIVTMLCQVVDDEGQLMMTMEVKIVVAVRQEP